jgi:hypothetical protein
MGGGVENESTVDHPGNAVVKTLTISLDAREFDLSLLAVRPDSQSFWGESGSRELLTAIQPIIGSTWRR